MEFQLAKQSSGSKTKKMTLEQIEAALKKQEFFYLSRENEHKNLIALQEYFEQKGHNVYIKEIKYGLGELDYVYEVHIL